jgi:hypothetical protein
MPIFRPDDTEVLDAINEASKKITGTASRAAE